MKRDKDHGVQVLHRARELARSHPPTNRRHTKALEDAELFLGWLNARQVPAVLHGHKHIPRFDKHGDIAVIGCRSTVGKVETSSSGQTYMSLNVVTIDRERSSIGCRLRAERIPGAGLESVESHELALRSALPNHG